jgi:hypothetical protein
MEFDDSSHPLLTSKLIILQPALRRRYVQIWRGTRFSDGFRDDFSPSNQIPGQYLEEAAAVSFPISFQIVIHQSPYHIE